MLTSRLFAEAHADVANRHPELAALVLPDQILTHDQLRRLGLSFANRMQAAVSQLGARA